MLLIFFRDLSSEVFGSEVYNHQNPARMDLSLLIGLSRS